MKRLLVILFLFLGWQCTQTQIKEKSDSYYIYDSCQLLKNYSNSNDSIDYLGFETYKTNYEYYDSILINKTHKYYTLWHYLKYIDYRDTSFIEHKSYLDTINYFDSEWLMNEDKLDSFWMPVSGWRQGGIYDTTEIYLIRPIENTDSVIFRQVHRWFHQTK